MWFYISQNKTDKTETLYTFNVSFTPLIRNTTLYMDYSMGSGVVEHKSYSISPGVSSKTIQLTKDELFESSWDSTTSKLVTFELKQNTTVKATGSVGVNLTPYTYSIALTDSVEPSASFTISYTTGPSCLLKATFNDSPVVCELADISEGASSSVFFPFSEYNLNEGDTINLYAESRGLPIVNYVVNPSTGILTDGGLMSVIISG